MSPYTNWRWHRVATRQRHSRKNVLPGQGAGGHGFQYHNLLVLRDQQAAVGFLEIATSSNDLDVKLDIDRSV